MDARRIVIVGRFGRRLFWCALGATLALGPGAASAQGSLLPGKDPCNGNPHPTPIPNCQNQVQGPITFGAGGQYNIAYHCDFDTGGHPNFYIYDNGWAVAVDPVTAETCFQATNPARKMMKVRPIISKVASPTCATTTRTSSSPWPARTRLSK